MNKVGAIGTNVILIGGAILALFIYRGINFAKNVELVFKSMRIGGTLFIPELYITLTIINPTSTTLTVDNVLGYVNFKGQNIGSVSATDTVHISGHSQVDIELRVVTTLADILETVNANIHSDNLHNQVSFVGTILTNNINVPVNTMII